jgi:ABC-type transport system involved in multi-copper enzyme maturation permease subunit
VTEKKGQIHDLGYKRYGGTRLAQSTRWRVIMREQIANGWKKWWRYKLALGGAVITGCVAGGLMFFMTDRTVRSIGSGAAEGFALKFADGVVPLSLQHFFRMAFVLSLTLGATIIASDTQSGAFTFYYVRSVRPRDYVLGKIAGYGFLVATIVLFGPLLIACLRLGLSDDTDQMVSYLHILPKIIGIGLLATLAYTTVPLAISALVPNKRYALALWAAYYLIIGSIASAMSTVGKSSAGVLDIQSALQAITFDWFDLVVMRGRISSLDSTTALIGLLATSAVSIAIIWYQVSRDQRSGVGGSS